MFSIVLYNFNKKVNSTKLPNVSGTSYSCVIKDVSSVLTPVVEIADKSGDNKIPLFNYAYISEFKRYYFIDDISYTMGAWVLAMHVDVLASFRTDIRTSTQYVARSSSNYDLTIADTAYLTKAFNSYGQEYSQSDYAGPSGYGDNYVRVKYKDGSTGIVPYFNQELTDGYFVVGIVGNNTTGVDYYWFSNAGFKEFINEAMTFTPSGMSDLASATANAVFNPLQYITSVRWFPDEPYKTISQTPLTKIWIGGFSIPTSGTFTYGGYAMNVNAINDYRIQIDVPKHPNGSTKKFLNLSPFSELNLVFQPFGCIPLDTTKLFNVSNITVQWLVDFAGGSCVMNVYRSGSTIWTPEGLLYTMSTDYGVQLPISSLVMDWKGGLAISALSWLKGTVSETSAWSEGDRSKSAGRPQPAGYTERYGIPTDISTAPKNTELLDKAMDITASALGQISTVGSVGSFLSYMQGPPYIMGWFRDIAAEDASRFGRPFYQTIQLINLSGFCLCVNANVNFTSGNPMNDEQLAVITALNSGIYLE